MPLGTTTEFAAEKASVTLNPQQNRADYRVLAVIAAAASTAAFLYFFSRNEILLYGDAVAHINIARRVFDSRTPGFEQLGTVWLPLPHLLMMPFVASDWAWRSGVGGSIASMIAYVVASLGIFRLVRNGLDSMGAPAGPARVAAWSAALIFLANPNLLYLQSTGMTESLSLALFVWATVFFGRFVRNVFGYSEFAPDPGPRDSAHAGRALQRSGWCLAGLMLTRYDGWFLAILFALAAGVVFVLGARRRGLTSTHFLMHWKWKRPWLKFVLVLAAAPALWVAYNAYVWQDPLEFATGPYSPRAIEERTRSAGGPRHPGWHAPWIAGKYFVKAARLNLGEWHSGGATFFPFAVLGSLLIVVLAKPLSYWLLLWLPVLFYSLAIAWGGVPVFIPPWWPFSYYNVRYGIQLLPAISVSVAAALYFAIAMVRPRPWRVVTLAVLVLLVVACYAQAWISVPVSLREAQVNSRSRLVLERALANQLRDLPPSATLLMHIGEHSGALRMAGIPLRRTIHEGNYPLWQDALAAPAAAADYVVAAAGDPVSQAVGFHPEALAPIAVIQTPGQGTVTIFRSTAAGF